MLSSLLHVGSDPTQFQNWIAAIYNDAALHAVIVQKLPLAAAVNQAIDSTLDELANRNAPSELAGTIHAGMLSERRSLIYALAERVGRRDHGVLLRQAQQHVLDMSAALAAQNVQYPRPRALALVV